MMKMNFNQMNGTESKQKGVGMMKRLMRVILLVIMMTIMVEPMLAPEVLAATKPTMKSAATSKITCTDAQINAVIANSGKAKFTEFGFSIWQKENNKVVNKKSYKESASLNATTITVWYNMNKWHGKLKPATTYYYEIYAKYASGKLASSGNFKTAAENVKVTHKATTNISDTNAQINATFTNPNKVKITHCGFEIWKTAEPKKVTTKKETVNLTNATITAFFDMNKYIGKLAPNTKYSFRIVAYTANSTIKGATSAFTTSKKMEFKTLTNGINDSSMFIKQQPNTCTLTSATMMLKRKAYLLKKADYTKINDTAIWSAAWINGTGLKGSFTFNGMSVTSITISAKTTAQKKSYLIDMLKSHPEGIVIYNTGMPHAVLLTDYDATMNTFYAADPAVAGPKGRVKLTQVLLNGNTQDNKIAGIKKIWYIK